METFFYSSHSDRNKKFGMVKNLDIPESQITYSVYNKCDFLAKVSLSNIHGLLSSHQTVTATSFFIDREGLAPASACHLVYTVVAAFISRISLGCWKKEAVNKGRKMT